MQEAARLGRNKKGGLKSGFFTRDLIRYIEDEGGLLSNEDDKYTSGENAQFLVDMLNRRRDPTTAQKIRIDYLMDKHVYPWLRGLWRESHRSPVA